MCPQHYTNLTAKQIYDTIAGIRNETATAPYATALEPFMSVRLISSVDDHNDRFLASLQNVNNAADGISFQSANPGYRIGNGQASANFLMGTRRIDWLSTWRNTRAHDANNEYAPLQVLMSTLRSMADNRIQQSNTVAAIVPNSSNLDPDTYCRKCRHRHKNRYFYRLHPELAPDRGDRTGNIKGEEKQAAAAAMDDDIE
ncbi:hypothetical protein K3495_g13495 [Podosphaera aphanis]|nr:hypothetical protein K3495_g13495 [Podosphaera aphanis]